MFLTLDIGTTAVKAALFDENLIKLGIVIREYNLLTPEHDLVELPATVYWENVIICVREVLARTGVSPERILSINCTTQGETLIPVDDKGEALYNAIVWLDARAKEEALRLEEIYTKEEFYAFTGIPEISPYCPIAKLLWFKEKCPEIYEKTGKLLLLEDYIIYKMTGRFVTNYSLMCTTGYFDIRYNKLWEDIFAKTGLDAGKIPQALNCGEAAGQLAEKPASELGLVRGTTVTTGAMDQAAASLGAGGCVPGFLSETTGTCLAVGASTLTPGLDLWSPAPVYSHVRQGLYLSIVVSQTAGVILKWFKDEFCPDMTGEQAYVQMCELAAKAPPLSRGLMLLPHFTGLNGNPGIRGEYVGISLETGRSCFIRAILEATGYMLKESLHLLGAGISLNKSLPIRSMGGGAKSGLWNQIKADICNAVIEVPEEEETASLGAAMLGAFAVKRFESLDECRGFVRVKSTFKPEPLVSRLYGEGFEKYLSLCARLGR